MIDWLLSSLLPLTIATALMLVFRKVMLKHVGSRMTYHSWLIVPISIACYQVLPLVFQANIANGSYNTIERMIVTSHQIIENVNVADWITFVYWSISLFILFVSTFHYVNFQKQLSASAVDLAKSKQVLILKNLNIQLPLKLSLHMSNNVQGPMITGFYKPKLIIPEYFTDLYNLDQQQLILEHEICHFDRNDIYWNLVAFIFLTLFWFHPLVWLAYCKFRQDQELSCDQTVLARKHLNSRINYSRALLLTAQNKPAFTIARISFNEYGDKDVMLERINQIKTTNIVKKTHTLMLSIVGVLLLTGISYAGGMGGTDAKHKEMKHENNVYPVMRIEPKYPVEAARNNVEGAVLLKFDINADGKTENIKVVNAKPAYVFDQEAITALSQWTYKVKNNQASRDYLVQLDFRMDDSSNSPIHLLERITVSK